jgi:hypothetical protein
MTNPPRGSDERDEGSGAPADPDRHATRPLPSPERPTPGAPYSRPDLLRPHGGHQPYSPQQPTPGPRYDDPQPRPSGQYGPPQEPYGVLGAPPYGPPQYGAPQYGAPQYGAPQYGAPQYGAAPYGPPAGMYAEPGPTKKSPVGLIVAVTVGILVLIAGGVVLALAMSSTVLDRNAVERDVAAQFEQREGVAIDLSCAEEMKVREGATYDCTGTTTDGEDVTLQIAITDEDSAAYTWTEP